MNKNIGIVVALDIEAYYLLIKMGVKEKYTYNDYSFYELKTYNGCIILAISGVGYSRAQKCMHCLLNKFNIDVIIHYGIAGALKDSLLPNTVVFADEVFFYDVIVFIWIIRENSWCDCCNCHKLITFI